LDDAENNIARLKDISAQSAARLKELASEWEKHRVPLVENYRALKYSALNAQDDTKELLVKIKEMREKMKDIVIEIQKKEEKLKQINEMFNSLSKDMNRATYTRRILEIVKQVKKQKVDIDKILIDTRTLKKEKSTLIDVLQRSFAVTTELVFKDAALKDPVAKQAYKDIVAMNEKFKSLTDTVEETGQTKNSTLDLEVKIEKISVRTESLDISRIEEDLKRIRTENQALIQKLKTSQQK